MGVPASCTDGFCGNVNQFVVDTATLMVTHLVVEPEHRGDVGKLVPVRLVEAADDSVEIDCDLADFDALADAEDDFETSRSNAVLPGHLAVRGDRPVHSTDGEIGKFRADPGRGRHGSDNPHPAPRRAFVGKTRGRHPLAIRNQPR